MTISSLRLMTVLAALQLSPAPGSITGTVIKAGTAIRQPLQNARLEIKGASSTQVERTDGNGRFAFTNLGPGQYRISVTRDGFIRQDYPKTITLESGRQSADILFELEPAPLATGRVLDTFGEPMPNVMVQALRRSYDVRGNPGFSRAASALTDDRGDYRIFWLDPGDYFFYTASPMPGSPESQSENPVAPTYFPGVNTPDDAKSLRLDIGREIRVDFRLRTAGLWSVNGHIMLAGTGRSMAASITLTPPGADPSFSVYHAQSIATGRDAGEFSMDRVAPGTYILRAKGGSGDQEVTAGQRIEIRPVLIAPRNGFTLTLGLSPPVAMPGRLFLEPAGLAAMWRATVALVSVDPDFPSPPGTASRPDGQFVLNGVLPGSYVLDVSNLPQDQYLKAARFGEDDVLEKPLTLGTQETPKTLQILIGSDGGHMQAAAFNARNEPQPAAQFVLVPDGPRRSRRDQYRVAAADGNGQAILHGIPPGNYKLFAWEHLEPNAYLNSDFLHDYEDRGVPVKIAAGDNAPVSVRLIRGE